MKKLFVAISVVLMSAAMLFAQGAKASNSDGKVHLTYWAPLNPSVSAVAQDYSETEFWKAFMEATNSDITFQHVSAANNNVKAEGFNILIASGDYPDIIEYDWTNYPGGPQAAIDDGVIIPLNDIIDQYAPNLKKLLDEHPDIAKAISTDDGTYYAFPFLRGIDYEGNNLIFSEGWVWRTDLLKKAGIDEIPETPDELYTALVALKNIGVPIPLCIRADHVSRVLSPGFDSWDDFYVEDGVVKNGRIEDSRKDYLEFVNKLYKEGLLDNDYLSVDKNTQAPKVLNSQTAVTYAPGGSGIGTWLPAMQEKDPSVEMHSSRPISPEKGRLSKFAKMNSIYDASGSSAAISTSCKNVADAARILDYNYSEEGGLLNNFGIEGVSYTMVDGEPVYTDLVMHNPDLPISQAIALYTRASISGSFVQDPRYLEQYYELPELKEAINLWAETDFGKYQMPTITHTSDEAAEIARIMNNVNTYASEMEAKFITGAIPLDQFDAYVQQLKDFGIERAIEIKQAAYDRYMAK